MNDDEPLEHIPPTTARALLPRYTTPAPPAEPLLLPPANPAYNREPQYDEQDIDGYTIAEAQAALEAFKRRRSSKAVDNSRPQTGRSCES